MTGNTVLDLLISISGIAVIVLLVRAAFPNRKIALTRAMIIDYLAKEEPDFVAVDWLIDEQARAALVADHGRHELIIVRPTGDHLIHRRAAHSEFSLAPSADDALIVRLNDPTFGPATLSGDGATDWVLAR